MLAWLVWPWGWTGDDWSGVQTLILLVAGGTAYWQASEARKLCLEQSRPFVVLDMDVRQTIAELRITNVGPTLARNVRFAFETRRLGAPATTLGRRSLNSTSSQRESHRCHRGERSRSSLIRSRRAWQTVSISGGL